MHTHEYYFPKVCLGPFCDVILALWDALSLLALHLSLILHFLVYTCLLSSAEAPHPTLLLQGSHGVNIGAQCKWGRPCGGGESRWVGWGLLFTLREGCDKLQPRNNFSVKTLKALLLMTQELWSSAGRAKKATLFHNHMTTTIQKRHSFCRLGLGRHKTVKNSMEVRSNCAFHIITKIPQTRMKDLCQEQRGKVLTPSIMTSQKNAVAETQGSSSQGGEPSSCPL